MDSRGRERKYTVKAAREAKKAEAASRKVEKQIKLAAREQQRQKAAIRSAERARRARSSEARRLERLQKEAVRSQKKAEEATKQAAREARKAVAAERKRNTLCCLPRAPRRYANVGRSGNGGKPPSLCPLPSSSSTRWSWCAPLSVSPETIT